MAKRISRPAEPSPPLPLRRIPDTPGGSAPQRRRSTKAQLRHDAEERIAGGPSAEAPTQPANAALHELQVYQVELEMQNEALRQSQIAAEESRDRYIDLYEFAPVGYLTLTSIGQIAEANLTAARLLGVERRQLLRRKFEMFIVTEQRQHWRQQFANALGRDAEKTCDLRLKHADGSCLQAELRCRSESKGDHPLALRVTLIDVSDRKRSEQALADSEAEYRALMETAADGIWVLDEEGRILAINDAYVRRSGYSREELLTMRVSDLEAQESSKDVRVHMENIRRNGNDVFESAHRTRKGEVWPVEVHVSYWETFGGRYFGFVRDLTERKRAEAALQGLRAEMEDVMHLHVASQTIAAMAHELNQPLNAVASYSEAALRMLEAGNPKPDRLKYALECNAQQARRAGGVVHDLFEFMNRGGIETAPVELTEMLPTALSRIDGRDFGTGNIRLEIAPKLEPVKANRLQIERVLVNLIQNSIEAMPGPGVDPMAITVAVTRTANGDMAQVTVRDTGPGVDDQALHRIFDPLFTTKAKGLGMGLAISRAIIDAHGGRLWAEPQPGVGACFHFTLPFAR